MMKTTIAISSQTRKKLSENGRKGETYDDIILRLLEKIRIEKDAE